MSADVAFEVKEITLNKKLLPELILQASGEGINPLLAWTLLSRRVNDKPSISRRQFLKLSATAAAAVFLAACGIGRKTESAAPKDLKSEILSFTWQDAVDNEKRNLFISRLADKYLELTGSDRLTKAEMADNVSFLNSRDQFTQAIQAVEPTFQPSDTQWGYTHYDSRQVFIDLETLKSQSLTQIPQENSAGLALLDALWHEWGHLDVRVNRQGELLNQPDMQFQKPDGTTEMLTYYRGGAAYTDTYYGFIRFDEVLLETITVRRMMENLELEYILSTRDYYQNGVDFFVQLTQSVGISVDELYQYHALSDFEGLAKRIGEELPGPQDSLTKGAILFVGIHQDNPLMINNSGVCGLLAQKDHLKHICP